MKTFIPLELMEALCGKHNVVFVDSKYYYEDQENIPGCKIKISPDGLNQGLKATNSGQELWFKTSEEVLLGNFVDAQLRTYDAGTRAITQNKHVFLSELFPKDCDVVIIISGENVKRFAPILKREVELTQYLDYLEKFCDIFTYMGGSLPSHWKVGMESLAVFLHNANRED